jgi:uncharacterized membrane protein
MTITVTLDNLVFVTGLLLGVGLTLIVWVAFEGMKGGKHGD